ncbi:hypothetical protein CEQ21_03335 [Niallia circulans]|uniref:ABC-2 type transport system permease protein n=1 Tax=Niallia circulans TaxID=1397 RepID=A0A553SSL5_NIACI|nr:ABC-2 transporter permease [Niallia circulans]TRZ39987.1 hypothetical protein CEQ21_03335 [Niallia circulans]
MTNFALLTKKELVQTLRELKVVWFPLVFIFLGMSQPIMNYYLPAIIKSLGGNQGIIVEPNMLVQKGGAVLAGTLGSQFDQLGVIIVIVSLMGTVQSDKANGMLAFIMTRPVSVAEYLSAKVVANYLFVAASVAIGYLVSYLYVNFLFSNVNLVDMLLALFFYLVWVLFIVMFTTMVSTLFNGQGIIALISIVILLLCRVIVGINPVIDLINPATMSKHAVEVLTMRTINANLGWNLLITLLLSILVILVSHKWIGLKKYHNV